MLLSLWPHSLRKWGQIHFRAKLSIIFLALILCSLALLHATHQIFSSKPEIISKEISKTIKSAVSNAENNNQLDIDNLFIKEAYVGKGIVMKRYRPRARGRAGEIKKPFANLTIIVSEKKQISSKEA